jgi:hypothetical protein
MLSELETANRVVDRLGSRFPGAPLTVIKDAVASAQHEYADAAVRGHLPVLIERAARTALLQIGYRESPDVLDTPSGRGSRRTWRRDEKIRRSFGLRRIRAESVILHSLDRDRKTESDRDFLVAGAGFEPTTSGL